MTFRKCLARDAAPRAKPHRLPPAKAPWAPAIRCGGRFWQYRMGGEGVEKAYGTLGCAAFTIPGRKHKLKLNSFSGAMEMHITRIKIKNYRGLRHTDVTFREGLNIVVGDNETGKSTLLEAINLALKCQINRRGIQYDLHPFLLNATSIDEWIKSHRDGAPTAPPEALIELFFSDDAELAILRGSNNSEKLDTAGIRLAIQFDDAFNADLSEYVKDKNAITGLPIEYYCISWMSFSGEYLTPKSIPLKCALIDPSSISNSYSANRYVLEIVKDYLSDAQSADLALAYRKLRDEFQSDPRIGEINKDLADKQGVVSDKILSVAMDATSKASWEAGILPHLNNIPLPLVGKGEQNSVKIRLAIEAHAACHLVLIEEPENHLSHTNLARLVGGISQRTDGKQLIVTTHSSFVLNKLGIGSVMMFNGSTAVTLDGLPARTKSFFDRLPGHDTLRLILARRSILVEGPSDELIVQKGYMQKHGKMPLTDGVEVISVGTAFKRFLDIAKPLDLDVSVVRDNDGDADEKIAIFNEYMGDRISIHIDADNNSRTLEPQIIKSNGRIKLNAMLDKDFTTDEELLIYMTANKTETALKLHEADQELNIPGYITDAIR